MTETNWLNSLCEERIKRLDVLYIANDAPVGQKSPGLQFSYHHEIYELLRNLGIRMTSSNNIEDLLHIKKNKNYVFTLLNRANFKNSEIFISAFCEYKRLAYLGAAPNTRALAEDKHLTKCFVRQLGLSTANWALYRFDQSITQSPNFEAPYFVKWRYGASSKDVETSSIANSWDDALLRIAGLHKQGKDAIVEEFLPGRSFTVPVIGSSEGPRILPAVETKSKELGGIVTFQQARGLHGGLSRSILHERKLTETLRDSSLRLYMSLDACDYIRVDFKENKNSVPNILEFNICCNLSSKGAICLAANSIEITQEELVSHILDYSALRHAKRLG